MWSNLSGPSGSDGETAAQVEQWQRLQRPDNEVAVVVPLSMVLARSDDVAVVVAGVQAHRAGFAFTLSALVRRQPRLDHDVFRQVAGHAPAGERLLLGLEFADGRRGSNIDTATAWPPALAAGGPQAISVMDSGGSGGGRRFDLHFWVTPLPPEGPLRFVLRWDAQQVAEAVVEVDGGLIASAGDQAQELWPWEPEDPQPWEPGAPQLPVDGWFAQLPVPERDR